MNEFQIYTSFVYKSKNMHSDLLFLQTNDLWKIFIFNIYFIGMVNYGIEKENL